MNRNITLSFCITCKNRFYQIKETLPKNLSDNKEYKDIVDFVLVDFGSKDGLQEWIAENYEEELTSGYLKYYYTEEMKEWHASVAKNTAHVLASNDIVVNLDCDNFTGINGAKFLLETFCNYGEAMVIHQFSNNFCDGTYGRIALWKNTFIKLGGYNEEFEPAGYQDRDLLIRLAVAGCGILHLNDKEYCKAIPNLKGAGVTSSFSEWEAMNNRNSILSRKNITSGKLIANQNKGYIGVVRNIYTFE